MVSQIAFRNLPASTCGRLAEARADVTFQPTRSMKALEQKSITIAHLGNGERKVALSGDSMLFHSGYGYSNWLMRSN